MIIFKVSALGPEALLKRVAGEVAERELRVTLLSLMQKNSIQLKRLIAKFKFPLRHFLFLL